MSIKLLSLAISMCKIEKKYFSNNTQHSKRKKHSKKVFLLFLKTLTENWEVYIVSSPLPVLLLQCY